jgi:hypothetical protein
MNATDLQLNKTAKEINKLMLKPIDTLEKILKEELKGSYGKFERRGKRDLGFMRKIALDDEFPGFCYFESKDKKRTMCINIKFNWAKWDKTMPVDFKGEDTIKFDVTDQNHRLNYPHSIPIKNLYTKTFINHLRCWLIDGTEIPWKEFKN